MIIFIWARERIFLIERIKMGITTIEIIYFVYIFMALYMLSLFVLLYIQNRKGLYFYPKGEVEPVSIVMPCYNEASHIGKAIEALLELNWPKDKIEIIVVDDKSSDNSVDVINKYVEKYDNVRLIINEKNSGGAAQPTNKGIRAAKFDYIAVADADSAPEKDALVKMIGFLQEDKKVGGVTCSISGKYRRNFLEKLQAIEYSIIAFTRKILDPVDAVYIMPGPFALYRKEVLQKVGGFDEKSMTQDIEMTWRILDNGYRVRMCLAARTESVTPTKLKPWLKQRLRWNIGGIQTLLKYKRTFLRKGVLGFFVVPLFFIGYFAGVLGLFVFSYLFLKRIYITYLATRFSLYLGTDVIRFSEFNLSLAPLMFFGISLFIIGIAFTLLGLSVLNEKDLRNKNWFSLIFYFLVYLSVFPILLIYSIYKFARGNYSW